jgi:hypothetical protein
VLGNDIKNLFVWHSSPWRQTKRLLISFSNTARKSKVCFITHYALIRDKKIILWFSYPITQTLILEILMHWTYQREVSDSLHSGTPQKRRDELQADWNSGKSEIRVLAASMQCGGVGLNFQHDSHVCMLFEAASTLDMELQIIIIPWILWFPTGSCSLRIALMLFASTAGWGRGLLEILTLS